MRAPWCSAGLMVAVFAGGGCAGRWLTLGEPVARQARDRHPRDYRVVLRGDSMVLMHDAVVRDDSLVEVGGGSHAVALADVQRVDLWQSGGERVTGVVGLGLVAGLFGLIWAVGRAVGGSGS